MAFSEAFLAATPLRRKVRIQYPLLLGTLLFHPMIISPLVYVSLLARDRAGVVPPFPPPTRRLRRVRHLSPAPGTQKANRDFLPHSLIGCGCGFPFPFSAG